MDEQLVESQVTNYPSPRHDSLRVPPRLLEAFEKGLGEDWDEDDEEDEEKKEEGGKQQELKQDGDVGGRGDGGARLDVSVAVEHLSFTLRYIPTPLPVSDSSRVAPDHEPGHDSRPGPGDPFGSGGGDIGASGGIGETAGRGLVTRPRTGGTGTGVAGVVSEGRVAGTGANVGGASDKLIAVEIPPGLLALGRYLDAILYYRSVSLTFKIVQLEAGNFYKTILTTEYSSRGLVCGDNAPLDHPLVAPHHLIGTPLKHVSKRPQRHVRSSRQWRRQRN